MLLHRAGWQEFDAVFEAVIDHEATLWTVSQCNVNQLDTLPYYARCSGGHSLVLTATFSLVRRVPLNPGVVGHSTDAVA